MRIEKIAQYNSLKHEKAPKSSDSKNYTAQNFYKSQQHTPSFQGKGILRSIKDFIHDIFEPEPEPSHKRRIRPLLRDERPWETHQRKQSPATKPIEKKPVEEVKTKPVEENVEKKPLKEIPNRYALIDEYDRRTKARVEFRKRTQGRTLTPDEKIERDRLRQEWSDIYHRLIPEHQSIIRTKTATDFTSEAEKQDYIMNYVLQRMDMSEESALDALNMFEQFGFRADFPRDDIIIDTTMTKLGCGIYTIPKECRSDKLLRRFIDVFGKFADNKSRRHPDDNELAAVLTSFVKKGHDIQEDTVLRGIELMKKIICQKANYERLDKVLVSSFDAKFKDSQPIKDALEELQQVAKDLKYILGADDKC